MAARLQRLLDSQQQLLRDISHELRSPLARLRNATELARDTHTEAQFDRSEEHTSELQSLMRTSYAVFCLKKKKKKSTKKPLQTPRSPVNNIYQNTITINKHN